MNREINFVCMFHQFVFPFAHFFPSPTHHSFFVDTERFIRNDQVFVYTQNFPISFTFRTGSQGRVETKGIDCRHDKAHTVCFETIGKGANFPVDLYKTFSFSFIQSRFYRFGNPGNGIFFLGDVDPVDDEI